MTLKIGFLREVMLEKQLSGHRVDRSICAWFWDQAISQPDSFKVFIFIPKYFIFLCLLLLFTFSYLLCIATTSYCFPHALSIPSFSWGNHFFGLHSSRNAPIDGHWGMYLPSYLQLMRPMRLYSFFLTIWFLVPL